MTQRALITGCSTGIGRAAAVELKKRGYEVVATARRPEVLDDLDVDARLRLDVDDDASAQEAVAAAGQVDVLVNNAGFGIRGPVERVPLAEIRRMYETNVFGAVRMLQAVIPQMRERGGGTIVNVSSVAGRVGAPLNPYYSSTKFALEAISEAAHLELNHFGIRVAIIEPGYIDTGFEENAADFGIDSPPYDELARAWATSRAVLEGGGAPGPEIVAQAIADAIEADPPKLRWPVGTDAEMVLGTRASTDDATFEKLIRDAINFHW